MLHRSLATLGVAVLALALAAPALAVRVHVRVEGAKTTIFGATEPRLTPVTGTITPPSGPAVTVVAETPLGALEAASRAGEFFYRVESFSFGPYVAQIGRLPGTATTGWVYKVNGVSPPVAATAYELEEGDRVLWYHATFGATGGPRTLRILNAGVAGSCGVGVQFCESPRLIPCYFVVSQDDNGRRAIARDLVFTLDGRRVRSRSGEICPDERVRTWFELKAAKTGFVRSQAVRRPPGAVRGGGAAALTGRSS